MKLYNEDCLAGMTKLNDESIDLVVTSPPYDNLREYNGYIAQWSFDKFKEIAKELYRVIKVGGVVVWVVGDATINGSETGNSFRQALWFKDCGFNLHDTMIYEKAQACFGSNLCYLQSFEYMFVFSKGKPKTINLLRDRKNVRHGEESMAIQGMSKDGVLSDRHKKNMEEYGKRKNIWSYGVGGGKTGHPAVFPRQLARDHILTWSNPQDVVLDPFSGSGTTAIEALNNNREFVGFEISEEYYKKSLERIEAATAQTNIFQFIKGV